MFISLIKFVIVLIGIVIPTHIKLENVKTVVLLDISIFMDLKLMLYKLMVSNALLVILLILDV